MNLKHWNDILRASDADILAWASAQPWAGPMRQCGQDAAWHAEGDVWTHTLMVCAEVARLEGYTERPREDQLALLFTALLHDAGKPATTVLDPETGRTRSPKHSLVGASLAREVLRGLGFPMPVRELIVHLVRYHGRPPYLLDHDEPEREVIRLSCVLRNDLLHLFSLADYRGRDALENSREEGVLDFWRALAVEHGCHEKPYAFANDQARFLFHRQALSSLHYEPHESYSCTVTLMSGVPGVGKDTWLAAHRPGLPVVSLDAIREEQDVDATDDQGRVIQAAREQCRVHLRAGKDFAFNATNVTRALRTKWIDLFADYGARIEIVYLEPPLATILKQNREREAAVPERVIRRLFEKAEIPTPGEAHTVVWWVADGR